MSIAPVVEPISLPRPALAVGQRDLARDNLRCSMADAGSYGAMVGLGETYLPAFALALGLSETSAGLVASLPVVAGGVMQLVSLHAIRRFGNEQRWVLLCATVQALSFLPLILAAMIGSISFPVLLAVASVYWAAGLASGPAWNTWMESVVPVGVRARYFAKRSRLQQITTMLGLLTGGLVLHWAETGGWSLSGFAALFFFAALARLVSATYLSAHRTDARLTKRAALPRTPRGGLDVSLSGRRLLCFLVAMQACVQISGPFFAPFMLERLGFSYVQFILLMTVAFLSRVLAMDWLTKLANRCGAATLLWLGAIGVVPVAALWIVSSNIVWLASVQVLSGIAWAAYELGFFLLFFETLPADRRTKMLTLFNLGNTVAMFAGATIGAVLLHHLDCTCEAYFLLFGLSSLGRFLTLGLLFRIKLRRIPIHAVAIRILGVRTATASLDVPVLPAFEQPSEPHREAA